MTVIEAPMGDGERQNRRLGDLLRHADPASDGRSPDAGEVTGWRQETLRTARLASRPAFSGLRFGSIPWLRPLAMTAVSGAVLIIVTLYVGQRDTLVDTVPVAATSTPAETDVVDIPHVAPAATWPAGSMTSGWTDDTGSRLASAATARTGAGTGAGFHTGANSSTTPDTRTIASSATYTPASTSAATSTPIDTRSGATIELGSRSPPARELPAVASSSRPLMAGKQPGSPSAPVPVAASASRSARTIQFRAPSGTRIIWTLDPSFRISGT